MDALYVPTRDAWRAWLDAHHAGAREVWLVAYRAHTGRPSVPYADAVEEALCVGWIDSTRRRIDAERYAQRFTPRRPGVPYSQTNRERLAVLLAEGRVHPDVAAGLGERRPEDFTIPDDIRAALQADPDAWTFFQTTTPAYQRIRAAYVDHARRQPAEFGKRLANLVATSARRQTFGYGIERFR